MPRQDDLIEAGRRLLINNYRQAPIVMERGEGCTLYDADGRRYLDMTAGIAVAVLGHAHAGLAEALMRRAFQGRVFFCNSGTEANEAALKLARRYQAVTRKQPERVELVAFENGFHGRTLGALSVTGQAKYREGFGPLVTPVKFIPFGDIAAARAAITDRTAAVIVEPIQAEGGINLPPAGFLQELRRTCNDAGALLIFD